MSERTRPLAGGQRSGLVAATQAVTTSTGRGDYAELTRRIKQAGLLERRPAYYGVKIALMGALFAVGLAGFVLLRNSWYELLIAGYFGVIFSQIGFLGHEAGHRQIFRSRRANDVLGLLLGDLLIGISFGWWVDKHNRHHGHPNQVGKDPDVAIGAIVFTAAQAGTRGGLARALARNQAYLFFPLLLLEGLGLHVQSAISIIRGNLRVTWLEAVLLLTHTAAYFAATFLLLSPLHAMLFIAVHQGLFGLYMGCAFAPNHKGMPMLSEQDKLDFLRHQVLTSRNVKGGLFIEILLGGLNYQIEHHLFPNMPRPHLRRSRVLVKAFCRQHGLSYCETNILSSYAQVLRHLHVVGAPLRLGTAG